MNGNRIRCAGLAPVFRIALMLVALSAGSASAAIVDVDVVSDTRGALPLYGAGSPGRADSHRSYVEARKGERYGIRIRNNTAGRIAVVVAVDGRNIISGKMSHLRGEERMYVLSPYESATYEGWRTERDTVNRFYFTEPGDSYAAAFGDRSAMGVIAAAVYREAPVPRSATRGPAPRTVRPGASLPKKGARAPGRDSGRRPIPPPSRSHSARSRAPPSATS